MRRVAVIGVSGAGKTTLARTLAARIDVPYVELDRFRHLAGWREATDDDFRRAVAEATKGEAWVVDGNYETALGDLVWARVDTFVWLDLPLPVVLARLVKRIAIDLVTQRDLFNGNRQTWRAAFWGRDALVAYATRHHAVRRREWPDKLARFPAARVVRLRSARDAEAFVAGQTDEELAKLVTEEAALGPEAEHESPPPLAPLSAREALKPSLRLGAAVLSVPRRLLARARRRLALHVDTARLRRGTS